MKDFRKWSTQALQQERENLEEKIADYDKYLSTVRSEIVSLLYRYNIQKWKESIRKIDSELAFRKG